MQHEWMVKKSKKHFFPTATQIDIMVHLYRSGNPESLKTIRKSLNINTGNCHRACEALEEIGVLESAIIKTSRYVKLTDDGRDAAEHLYRIITRLFS